MTTELMNLARPPGPSTQTGPERAAALAAELDDDRRVGVELELADLSVAETSALVAKRFDAEVRPHGRHQAEVVGDADGAFTVELDTSLAAKLEADSETVAKARAWFGDLASLVVPVEVACPPLPMSRIGEVDALAEALRRAGASGTHRSLFYAFGTHLNIEAASMAPEAILRVLRAYLLLEDWLRAQIDVSPSRSAAGFEKRFPADYQRLTLDAGYAPAAQGLIDDYLRHNPSRNRGLDLLPILAELDEGRVRAALPQEKISARPAFHYRLPNSEIDDPRWSVRTELRRWGAVERLAGDPERLSRAMSERLTLLEEPLADLLLRSRQIEHSLSLGAEVSRSSGGEALQ